MEVEPQVRQLDFGFTDGARRGASRPGRANQAWAVPGRVSQIWQIEQTCMELGISSSSYRWRNEERDLHPTRHSHWGPLGS